ncbi:signal recognition particle-docking protein FtsY [Fuerstiella marisgermanici]|uniref:Signal recognition particle receptor FtsY n=1 Tax=Fuerstiella marisgermanici TaxID=1891926 RepID=A0A1P8WPX3_9PLAN|nr:signal recognition particle-docking protein FtsY [Fuerstiella marisgermanici]APZ96107.1 Signal recognition particle receptor FtsY [Fuerstiella marisgermanici]
MGLFDRLKAGLKKTKDILRTDLRDLFKAGAILDDDVLEEFEGRLIRTDMGVAASDRIVTKLREDHGGRTVDVDAVWDTVRGELRELLKGDGSTNWDLENPLSPLAKADSGPTVILVAGVNGVGKTTSIAKISNLLQKNGNKVVLAAGDTFRAAAVEQLTMWSERLGCDIVRKDSGADPASVAYEGATKAVELNADYLIVDTAGRLQTQKNLMDELDKIRRVLQKVIPEAPHESLLVLDATTGQNGLSQAKSFSAAVECTGLVLAKLDGTARGGVTVAIRQEMGIPVKYIGVGEGIDDLEIFDPDGFVDALFSN